MHERAEHASDRALDRGPGRAAGRITAPAAGRTRTTPLPASAAPDLATLLQRSSTEQSWTSTAPPTRIRRKEGAEAAAPAPSPLPAPLRSGIESLSGLSVSDVRVHYNSPKPAQLQALAYTQGTDIHVGPGQERHLPHEAWHVVQQKQGRVKPTLHLDSTNDDPALEREADQMADRAARGDVAPPAS